MCVFFSILILRVIEGSHMCGGRCGKLILTCFVMLTCVSILRVWVKDGNGKAGNGKVKHGKIQRERRSLEGFPCFTRLRGDKTRETEKREKMKFRNK